MSPHGFFRAMRVLFLFGIFCLFGLLMIGRFIIRELLLEAGYRKQYGENWRTEFENIQGAGALAHAHLQLAVAAGALASLIAIAVWVYRKNAPQKRRRGSSGSARRR